MCTYREISFTKDDETLVEQLQYRQKIDKIRQPRHTASTRRAFREILESFKASEPIVVGMNVVLNCILMIQYLVYRD